LPQEELLVSLRRALGGKGKKNEVGDSREADGLGRAPARG